MSYMTLKSFEKIGNLTNKLNVLQCTTHSNRHYLEKAGGKKNMLSDYLEEEALKAIDEIESRIVMYEQQTQIKKNYDIHPGNNNPSKKKGSSPAKKKGVSNKKPIVII